YPGTYINKADGDQYVSYRMEAEEVPYNTVSAVSDCSSFIAGGKFKLTKHDTRAEQDGYLITSITHNASDSSYFSGSEGKSEYGNTFICIPDTVNYRPEQAHTQPRMPGPQSAIVTGPPGEEIYIDEYGRIKVQFMWDREGKKDENSTCFIRVVQPWAGNNWGTVFTPRIGMEVIVDFLDGNPDRPIITGSVYNQNNMPPFDAKTQSGIKTHSTKDGSASNYNELRFEDKKDSEQIYIHAEKNLDSMVENNETLTVDNDRTKTIKHDENSSIGNDRNKSVGNNQSESIGKDKSIDVGGMHTESIGKDKTLDVAANHSESIAKNMSIDIGENLTESVGKNYSSDIGKKLVFNAGDEITLKTGSASIVMKKNGDITIKGNNIKIQGSGKVDVKASGNLTLKGSKVSTN
ncbi:MAG: type VI secretion system tip protein VgrG, partial [Gammaproteobacteria bacterium]|nr:type VI secretion system tip protein VgrG [Gammaproteobacteria bacterium]